MVNDTASEAVSDFSQNTGGSQTKNMAGSLFGTPASERIAGGTSATHLPGPDTTTPKRGKNRWSRRMIMVCIWIAVLTLMVLLALMLSAWITGFRTAGGAPDVAAMIEWLKQNYNLTK